MSDQTDHLDTPDRRVDRTRAARRLERQARVGILRNPNRTPPPPPRRAALTGRWPRLQSSRRPAPGGAPPDPGPDRALGSADAAPSMATPDAGADTARIDIARPTTPVQDLGQARPRRAPHAKPIPGETGAHRPPNPVQPGPPGPAARVAGPRPDLPRPVSRHRARRLLILAGLALLTALMLFAGGI